MNIPKWSKPVFYGAVVGAAALTINGFSWGGWVTDSKAKELAADAVVAALVPICIEQSDRDPKFAEGPPGSRRTPSFTKLSERSSARPISLASTTVFRSKPLPSGASAALPSLAG